MSTVIKVENLAKSYIIGHQTERYQTLRDIITNNAVQFGKRLLHPFRASSGQPLLGVDSSEEFWALDDVSFDIQQGDRVGIIGRNGAGKSTLLKILSRITEPTRGKVSIKGRVASLLEVGTGFHPELTGRENIYLNGAILGMSKIDIRNKFDEIVAFAEVEKFLDTPVKRYSSGMYVRLAFSVAAHLEPEILIVDEVLAVGDAQFQKKCLGRMEEVGEEGRTVLFVSHNMGAINQLCERAVLLDKGSLQAMGSAAEVSRTYAKQGGEKISLGQLNNILLSKKSKPPVIIKALEKISAREKEPLTTGENCEIRIEYEAFEEITNPAFVVSIADSRGVEIVRLSTMPISGFDIKQLKGSGCLKLKLDALPLLGGVYQVSVQVVKPRYGCLVNYPDVMNLEIQAEDVYGSGKLLDNSKGLIKVSHAWELS